MSMANFWRLYGVFMALLLVIVATVTESHAEAVLFLIVGIAQLALVFVDFAFLRELED